MRFLRETPPLVGTLGRSEVEYAAALILFGLHHLGRDWSAALREDELLGVLGKAIDSDPVKSWRSNPFLQPDFAGLIAAGFAVSEASPEVDIGPHSSITLTPAALERVAEHIAKEAV